MKKLIDLFMGKKSKEALMITDETRTSIKKIYGMLWDVLALYENTDRKV